MIIWAIFFPVNAAETLAEVNRSIIREFAGWYIYLVAAIMATCLALAIFPMTGRLKIGLEDDEPEFSRVSWFSMLFGAGIGVGMLTYAVGEPMAHFSNNPAIIEGHVAARSADAVPSAYLYAFLHWGIAAWATYALVGLAIGYVAYRRSLPLTIRLALAPIFGKAMSGFAGHVVEVVPVVATLLGIAVTMGLGVEQFIAGAARLGLQAG
nr:BCCT family transporter [Altericroceibacterium indicum]